jgi:hypothetical protein
MGRDDDTLPRSCHRHRRGDRSRALASSTLVVLGSRKRTVMAAPAAERDAADPVRDGLLSSRFPKSTSPSTPATSEG